MTLIPGTSITGSRGTYLVEQEITRGGMGVIYSAKSNYGQKVVIKEPLQKFDPEDPIRLEKLKVEAQILAKLNHEHIVKYIDESKFASKYYLIIEFVDGEQLLKMVNPPNNKPKPLSESQTRDIIMDLLDALKYMHQKNIIHRDINPKNILKKYDIKLIDFGAAKDGFTQLVTFGHTIIGTPGWSAPEQFMGLVTPQCDIYAVGTTMFFLLIGTPPRKYLNYNGQLNKTPRDINPKISKEMSEIVIKSMDVDPNKRYQLAEDMKNIIKGFSLGSTIPSILCLGKRYPINKTFLIGRQHPCDIIIPDTEKYISRKHAQIYYDSGQYWIEDLKSRNGTFLYKRGSFQEIHKSSLKDKDLIALCHNPVKGPYITINFNS